LKVEFVLIDLKICLIDLKLLKHKNPVSELFSFNSALFLIKSTILKEPLCGRLKKDGN